MESLRTKDPQKPVEEPPKITELKELWTWIESFIPSKNNNKEKNRDTKQAELRIAQLRQICQKLGSPQQQFRSVHIAGSKGKGQTASYIASGLAALDFRVGLFRSPHIHDYRERIQLLQLAPQNPDCPTRAPKSSQNEASDKPELRPLYEYFADNQAGSSQAAAHEKHPERSVHCLDITQTLLEQGRRLRRDLSQFRWAQEFSAQTEYDAESYLPIHFFAVLTLLAYRSFAALKCDWAVIETGIGGRLCPTNIICPELSVLTPIELEHTELLGETLEQIATEKAHIIKKKRPCVSATQKVEVQTVLRSFCAERQSPLYFFGHLQSCKMPQNSKPFHNKLEFPVKFPEWARPFLQPRHFACHLKLREANTDNNERPNQSPKHDKPDSKDFVLRLKACSSTQVENLQLALLALLCLEQQGAFATTRHDKTDIWPNISQSVQKSVESVPGRFSCYWHETEHYLLLFDAAHTPHSCKRLLEDIESYLTGKRPKISLLFGAVKGKKFSQMAQILVPYFDEICLTRAGTFKENDPLALQRAFNSAIPLKKQNPKKTVSYIEEPRQALQKLTENEKLTKNAAELVVICGSFYLLGELLPKNSEPDAQST